MDNFSPSSCDDRSEPPVPRPRRPIRYIHIPEGNDLYTLKNSEHLLTNADMCYHKYNNQECFNTSKSDDAYTDDDEDDNENSSFSFLDKTSFIQPTQSTNWSSTKHNRFLYFVISILIICLVFGIIARKETYNDEEELTNVEKVNLTVIDNILKQSIKIIQTKFHNQRASIWNDISAAIYDVTLFPTRPSIIILFGNGADTLNCLAQLLGQLSGKILGSNDYLTLTPRDFPNDVGQTIHKLKVPILEKKVVVVKELLNINAKAVRAFHNFCDREMPLVKHSIYIITITVNGYNSSQRELEFISKQMFERLSSYIDEDILYPLITRLTDGAVVSIAPELSTTFNHAYCSIN